MKKEFLVTEEEAIRLCEVGTTATDAVFARNIYIAFLKACEKNPLLVKEFALAAVFNAGRVQGIREERKRAISHKKS